jgi:single-strand DNA-binding protein
MNKVFLMGHLGQTPALETSKTGKPFTRLSLATNRQWLQGDEAKEATDWHSVFVWGRQAEQCVTFLQKGALVFVEGSLTYWKVNDAQSPLKKDYKNAIHGNRVHFLNSRGAGLPMPAVDVGGLPEDSDGLDNLEDEGNHNAVAHLS